MKRAFLLPAFLLMTGFQPARATEAPAGPSVVKLTTCHHIESRKPGDVADHFSQDGGDVFGHVVLANPGDATQVRMVWKQSGVERWTIALKVGERAKGWHTWSHKHLGKKDAGEWTVEVQTLDGTPLQTAAFTVDPATPTASR